jgi:hypothetical protein
VLGAPSFARCNVALSSDFPSTINPRLVAHIQAVNSNPRIAWVAPHTTLAKLRFPLAKVASALEAYDVVYLTGGDPLVFRQSLQQSGLASGRSP